MAIAGFSLLPSKRSLVLWAIVLSLFMVALGLLAPVIHGSSNLHTVLEFSSTILAAMAGSMALIRYYTKRDDIFLTRSRTEHSGVDAPLVIPIVSAFVNSEVSNCSADSVRKTLS